MLSGFITIAINKIIARISHGVYCFSSLYAAISKMPGIRQHPSDEHPGLDGQEKILVSNAVIDRSEGNERVEHKTFN